MKIKEILTMGYEVAFMKNADYNKHIRDEKSSIDVYIHHSSDKVCYVSAKGSTDRKDWITNFLFFPTKINPYGLKSKVKFHSGYMKGYHRIRAELLNYISSLGCTKFIVSGYSQGGAVADIIALDLQYNLSLKGEDILVFNFNGPKWCNKAGVKSFNTRLPYSFRVDYSNDIVPLLPPLGYIHASNYFYHFGDIRDILHISLYKDHVASQYPFYLYYFNDMDEKIIENIISFA